jgi:hypothetical protein
VTQTGFNNEIPEEIIGERDSDDEIVSDYAEEEEDFVEESLGQGQARSPSKHLKGTLQQPIVLQIDGVSDVDSD